MSDRPAASMARPLGGARKTRGLKALLATTGAALGALAVLAALASAFGTRLGLWQFRQGFQILTFAGYGGTVAAAVSLLALVWRRERRARSGLLSALLGLVLGFASFAYPVYLRHVAESVPRIHDITTDLVHPPAFVAVLPLRAGAENPPTYGGAEVAKEQQEGYPNIKPLHFAAPPAAVFAAALATVKDFGWEVVASVPAAGRIEATDTTFWYHFKDDVVIRIAADGGDTRVDMRSESRVGRSDFGVNARRVTRYLAALERRMARG